jgi:CRP-like cAMP-binding protein
MAIVQPEPLTKSTTEELHGVFPFLSEAEIAGLQPLLEPRQWQAGEVVLREGEAGTFMGFLVRGKLAVKKETVFPGKFILVAVLEPGSLVGELSMAGHSVRSATVFATEPSRLLLLSPDGMDALLDRDPGLAVKLLQRIIFVLGHRLRGASDRLARLL